MEVFEEYCNQHLAYGRERGHATGRFPGPREIDKRYLQFLPGAGFRPGHPVCKENGAHLKYQIERWDRSNQLAEIWVRVDTVYGNNGSQYFTMYWGKSPVDSRSNGAGVFDTANGFAAVYHMNDPTATNGTYLDATQNANNGTGTDVGTQTSAIAGYGTSYSIGGQIVVPYSTINAGTGGGAVSMWSMARTAM